MTNPKKMFFENPKNFFEQYSINLPGNPQEAGKIGQMELYQSTFKPVEREKGVGKSNVTGSSMTKSFYKFSNSANGVQVKALAHNAAWKVDDAQKKATLIVRKAPATTSQPETETEGLRWFLCLMLPWVDNGVTSMKLRRESRANAFFTGQMNGCSFAVTGDPSEPFVSHINCADKSHYQAKYQDVLTRSGVDNKSAKRLGREDYKLNQKQIGAHEHVIKERLAVQNRKLTSNIITDTLCFVMGRRIQGNWEFFYQRVITHQFKHIRRLGKAGGIIKFFGRDNREKEQNVIYRSLDSYTKLWPDGPGRLSV